MRTACDPVFEVTGWLGRPNDVCTDRGLSGPHDAGHYNSSSWETGFFVSQGGSWSTPYGHFFLSWYSGLLLDHANKILTPATEVLNKHGRPRVFKGLQEVRSSNAGQLSMQAVDPCGGCATHGHHICSAGQVA